MKQKNTGILLKGWALKEKSFKGKPVSKKEYIAAYENYFKRCSQR